MTNRANRPSPSISASTRDIGTVMTGNDGNQWEIRVDSRGVKSWKKYDSGRKTPAKPKPKIQYPKLAQKLAVTPDKAFQAYITIGAIRIYYQYGISYNDATLDYVEEITLDVKHVGTAIKNIKAPLEKELRAMYHVRVAGVITNKKVAEKIVLLLEDGMLKDADELTYFVNKVGGIIENLLGNNQLKGLPIFAEVVGVTPDAPFESIIAVGSQRLDYSYRVDYDEINDEYSEYILVALHPIAAEFDKYRPRIEQKLEQSTDGVDSVNTKYSQLVPQELVITLERNYLKTTKDLGKLLVNIANAIGDNINQPTTTTSTTTRTTTAAPVTPQGKPRLYQPDDLDAPTIDGLGLIANKDGEYPILFEATPDLTLIGYYGNKILSDGNLQESILLDIRPVLPSFRKDLCDKIYLSNFASGKSSSNNITNESKFYEIIFKQNASGLDVIEDIRLRILQYFTDFPEAVDKSYIGNQPKPATPPQTIGSGAGEGDTTGTPLSMADYRTMLEGYKKELEQLYMMRSFLSPVAFEKKLELNQRIYDVQQKINESNFNLMEKEEQTDDIIEDLFEQSFTPLNHEYNNVYSSLGEAEKDTAQFFAPDGTPSELSDDLNEVIRTPQFIEWFGNWQLAYNYKDIDPDAISCSKIMTEHYEPMVVWHGTGAEFSYFNFQQFPAAYFARNKNYAEWFAEQKGADDGYILPFFLDIKNPLDLSNFGTRKIKPKEFFDYVFLKTGLLPNDLEVNPIFLAPDVPEIETWVYLRRNPAMLKKIAESHIFDGIHFYETNPAVPQNNSAFRTEAFIVFKAGQCKLAESRRGKILQASLKSFLLKRGGRV